MCRLIAVSNKALCQDNFAERIRKISALGIPVILREKDLDENEYYQLLCSINVPEITAHTYVGAARRFGCKSIHMPLSALESMDISGFKTVGASVHSATQAIHAARFGATYLTAGHIFVTDCKKGMPPRGTDLIREIKASVSLPVYAIGGITPQNADEAINAGADGVCIMSGFMACEDIDVYAEMYSKILWHSP